MISKAMTSYAQEADAVHQKLTSRDERSEESRRVLSLLRTLIDEDRPRAADLAARRLANRIVGDYWRKDRPKRVPDLKRVETARAIRHRLTALYSVRSTLGCTEDIQAQVEATEQMFAHACRRVRGVSLLMPRELQRCQRLAERERRMGAIETWDCHIRLHMHFRPMLRDGALRNAEYDLNTDLAFEAALMIREALGNCNRDLLASTTIDRRGGARLAARRPSAKKRDPWFHGTSLCHLLKFLRPTEFIDSPRNVHLSSEERSRFSQMHEEEVEGRLVMLARVVLRILGVRVDAPTVQTPPLEQSIVAGARPASMQADPGPAAAESADRKKALSHAVVVVTKNSAITFRDLEDETGVPRSTLCRHPQVRSARETAKKMEIVEPIRGFCVTSDGLSDVEAIDPADGAGHDHDS